MAEAKALKRQKLSQELESSVVVESQELECSVNHVVYAYLNLPVVHMYLPVVKKFLPSTLVNYLQGMGIAPLAKSLAERKVPLAGRIQYCLTNWECITQDQWILDAVQGFKIPFTSTPRQAYPPRGKPFSPEEETLLDEEIPTMLHKQAIEECPSQGRGFLSSVFLIPKKDGGQRPVINLKSLNEFVRTEHFKMEGIHLLKDLLRQGDWMVKVDLKDVYFTVPIHKQDRDFLKFAFKNKTYRLRCLPFGLACAPWVFTKTLKPVAAQLRQLGVRLIVYIDDILILAETPDLARDHVIGLIYLLENLGFIVSLQKCVLEPTQKIDFLGFLVDSVSRELRLPADKIKKIRSDLQRMLSDNSSSARKLA